MRVWKGLWIVCTIGALLAVGRLHAYYDEMFRWFLLLIAILAVSGAVIVIKEGRAARR
jgi:hypothetical protein